MGFFDSFGYLLIRFLLIRFEFSDTWPLVPSGNPKPFDHVRADPSRPSCSFKLESFLCPTMPFFTFTVASWKKDFPSPPPFLNPLPSAGRRKNGRGWKSDGEIPMTRDGIPSALFSPVEGLSVGRGISRGDFNRKPRPPRFPACSNNSLAARSYVVSPETLCGLRQIPISLDIFAAKMSFEIGTRT